MRRRQFLTILAGTTAVGLLSARRVRAEGRSEDLRLMSGGAPNSFDPISIGFNGQEVQVTWNVYDRLVRFAAKTLADGTLYYDYFKIEPELAERFEVSSDRTTIVFHLRKNATFHDGSPVTAADVKWSLDRVVASPVGRPQFATGSLTSPDQFVVVDEHTVKVTTPRADRFTLPNLALTFPIIINSKLAMSHATADDPWASAWLKTNEAGGGAFAVARFTPGESLIFARFDAWKSGPLPGFRRILWQVAPAPEARLAALERGDADVVQDVPPQDAARLAAESKVKVVNVPIEGAFQFIGMNGLAKPFDDVRVRQAIAYALPYRQMFDAALFGRGRPLFGGEPGEPKDIAFPQPLGYDTDPAKARRLLAEAGYPDGFATTFSFELSNATVGEPVSLLVQEALGKVGVRLTINKVPAGQFGTLLAKKEVPLYFEGSIAYLSDPDYFFRIFYHGDTRWNFGSYKDAEFSALVDKTRFETDKAAYETDVKRMITLAKRDVPIILLWQPALDTAMRQSVAGYEYEFHRQLELRTLKRV